MYEALYAPLPDRELYLQRIGARMPLQADLEHLNRLIYAHQCQVAFENLDIFELDQRIDLGIQSLYDKIVVRKRGGYCFELNGLFLPLLKACGFQGYSCRCRIVRGKDYLPPSLHRGILVNLQGNLWFCDVGYGGPMPAGALKVTDGFKAEYCGQTFRIDRFDAYWWTVSYVGAKKTEQLIQFTTMPYEPVEFLLPNEYCSRNETSLFRTTRIVNRRTPEGSYGIKDDVFTIISSQKRTEKKIQSREELNLILKTYFDIALTQ